jgi:hypothetical protein
MKEEPDPNVYTPPLASASTNSEFFDKKLVSSDVWNV